MILHSLAFFSPHRLPKGFCCFLITTIPLKQKESKLIKEISIFSRGGRSNTNNDYLFNNKFNSNNFVYNSDNNINNKLLQNNKNEINHANNKKNTFTRRQNDWICKKCHNLNFAFRIFCNRCSAHKKLSVANNNNL